MATRYERAHAVLDGEIERSALSAAELRDLEALEGGIFDAAAALRGISAPDLTAGVMGSLPAAAAPLAESRVGPLQRIFGWLWSPVSLSIRPAYGLGAVAVAALALAVLPGPPGPVAVAVGPPVASESAADPQIYVQFRIEVSQASQVALSGSFTDWRPALQLTEVSPGVWSAMVPLEPGVHDYTYVIDGTRMVVDPHAPRVADSFGGSNSRLFLPAPDEQA